MDLAPPYQGEIGKGWWAQISAPVQSGTVRDRLSVVVWCWMLVHQTTGPTTALISLHFLMRRTVTGVVDWGR
jgi:hypothetical protein